MITNIEKKIKNDLDNLHASSVLIHSDLMKGFAVSFNPKEREKFILEHFEKLRSLFNDTPIFMPSFNYKFLGTKKYNMQQSPSEVGVLSEYFRTKLADWRTKDPVFSFSGTGKTYYKDPVGIDDTIDPFGDKSFFNYLYENNTLLFHYGSEFKHSTILHYIERISKVIPYRYDKLFEGTVTNMGAEIPVKYNYLVRPMGKYLDYDWDKITTELTNEKILFNYNEDGVQICFCHIQPMIDFLNGKIKKDPFYFLDAASLEWVVPSVEKLNRGFLIKDFE